MVLMVVLPLHNKSENSTNSTKAKTNLYLSFHYIGGNHYLFDNGKICKFKVINKDLNFPSQLCFRCISEEFDRNESLEIFLKENVYDFLDQYATSDKSDMLNNHNYLMFKNNIKQ